MNTLADQLRASRAAAGLSQDALAARLHVTRQSVSHWETGRSEPDLDTLAQLARELGTDAATLLGETAPQSASEGMKPARRRHTALFALGTLVLILFIADIWIGPWVRYQMRAYYNGVLYSSYIFGYRFLQFGLLGAALGAAANAISGGRAHLRGGARAAALAVSLLALAVFYSALVLWLGGNEATGFVLKALYRLLGFFLQSEQIRVLFPSLSGLLLYFGLKK